MTNREIAIKLEKMILEERKITNDLLALIALALDRKSYLELGFSSMFDWLIRGFGYSNAAAFRRIEAARLIKAVLEAAEKLANGEVNLTTLSKANAAIRNHERTVGAEVSSEFKADLVEKIQTKSSIETEEILVEIFPESQGKIKGERQTFVDAETTRFHLNFKTEASENLARAREMLSHTLPNATDSEILAYALEFLLKKIDPLRKATSAAEVEDSLKKPVSASRLRIQKIKEANASCGFKDPITGRVCGSRFQLELDHIRPKAMGGTDEPDNLRVLCRQHNLYRAEQSFGRSHMERFTRRSSRKM